MGWSVPRRLLQIMRFWMELWHVCQPACNCLPITFQKQAAFPLIIRLWRNHEGGDLYPKLKANQKACHGQTCCLSSSGFSDMQNPETSLWCSSQSFDSKNQLDNHCTMLLVILMFCDCAKWWTVGCYWSNLTTNVTPDASLSNTCWGASSAKNHTQGAGFFQARQSCQLLVSWTWLSHDKNSMLIKEWVYFF